MVADQASVDELDPSTGEPLNQDRVLLRRGRIVEEILPAQSNENELAAKLVED